MVDYSIFIFLWNAESRNTILCRLQLLLLFTFAMLLVVLTNWGV